MAIFRVPIHLTYPGAGSPGANIWHIRTIDTVPAQELTQANNLIGYIRNFYFGCAGLFPTGMTCTLGTVSEELTAREIVPTMNPLSGTGTSSAPQLLAICVTWKTGVAARRGRGRTFVGPLAFSAMEANGTPTSTALSTVNMAADTLISSSTGGANGAIGVWGYANPKPYGKENPRNPSDPKVFRDVVGRATRDLFASLRSRRD